MAGSSEARQRFVLRKKTGGLAVAGLPEKLQHTRGVKVIDASPRMVLVDAAQSTLKKVVAQFDDWEMVPETFTPVPDTRVKLGRR